MKYLELDDLNIKINFGDFVLNILYMRFSPPSRIIAINNHFHSSYELHFIPYGEGELKTNKQSYKIKPRDFYVTGPNVYHAQKGNENNPMAEYCINFEIIKGKSSEKEMSKDHEIMAKTIEEIVFWFGKDMHNSIELFEKIEKEVRAQYVGYIDSIKHHIHQILLNCVRSYLNQPYSFSSPPIKSRDDYRRLITDYYLHRFKEDISISELANQLQLSERQTRRFFLSIYGISLQEKVKEMRIELAKDLLVHTDMKVTKIAEMVGYQDPLYFSKVFTKSIGLAPSKFRKQLLEANTWYDAIK